jgi:hypothetical protein
MSSSDTSAPLPITHIQALYFELIRTIRYNELDGEQVVADLLRWRDLWDSVIADRQPTPRLGPTTEFQYNVYPPLSLLRTTRYDDWPADTLYVWTDDERLPRLRRLIEKQWQGCAIDLVDQEDVAVMFHGFYRPEHRVLELWWD